MSATHPNIIYILADDLGYGDLSCYNPDSMIPTPNLDALASQGMRFTDAHAPSSVCTPSRYSILCGRYCWRTALKQSVLWPWDASLIEPDRLTVGQMLSLGNVLHVLMRCNRERGHTLATGWIR